eukprot:gene5399-5937_t
MFRSNFSRILNQQRALVKKGLTPSVRFGSSHGGHGGHGSHEPHVPEGYAKAGKTVLVICYLWVMYRFKEDGAQMFGFYKPWLHEHDHGHELHYHDHSLDHAPALKFHDDDEEDA